MEHLLLPTPRMPLLLINAQASVLGKPVGFGNSVRHVHEGFQAAHGLRARLWILPPRRPLNEALFQLVSPDVPTVPRGGWAEAACWVLWYAGLPARRGGWRLWCDHLMARAARGAGRRLVGLRARVNKRGRRVLARSERLERWGRTRSHRIERTMSARWRTRYRAAGRAGRKRLRKENRHAVRIRLSPQVEAAARREAEALGLDLTRRIACLHVREGGYHRYAEGHRRDLDAVRNAGIDTYGGAIDRLVAAGYAVVRIGDASMTPLGRAGVLDLATSGRRTDQLELWCVLHSRLLVTGDSGPYVLAVLANVPCLAVNVVRIVYYIARPRDRFVCKQALDRTSGHRLSIGDMLSEAYLADGLDTSRYQHLDNTPEDLAEAVEDMLDVLAGDMSRSPAQHAYDGRLADLWRRPPSGAASPYRQIVRPGGRGTISRRFAERHFSRAESDPGATRPPGPARVAADS